MSKPRHLIIIGAQRSGTTSLYHWFARHPSVYMAEPVRPEPKYFLQRNPSIDGYISQVFPEAPASALYLGEKSTSYYEVDLTAERMHRVVPDAQLLVMLRDPVERALSNYYFSVSHGLETRSLREVFIENLPSPEVKEHTSVNPFNYLGRGMYARLLNPFKEKFGTNLHLIHMEGFMNDTLYREELLKSLELERIDLPLPRMNTTPRVSVPEIDEVRDYLRAYYSPSIDALEREFDFDASSWH